MTCDLREIPFPFPFPFFVLFAPCLHARLHHTCSHTSTSAIHQHHNGVDMMAEQCVALFGLSRLSYDQCDDGSHR